MTRKGPWEGVEPKILQRVVFIHVKMDPKLYWLRNGKIASKEKLANHLPKMIEQLPPDFRVVGDITRVRMHANSDCKVCGGVGHTIGDNPSYVGVLHYSQANPCDCRIYDEFPWRTWSPTGTSLQAQD